MLDGSRRIDDIRFQESRILWLLPKGIASTGNPSAQPSRRVVGFRMRMFGCSATQVALEEKDLDVQTNGIKGNVIIRVTIVTQ